MRRHNIEHATVPSRRRFGHRLAPWLLAAGAGCVATDRYDGPLAVRNQHPAQLTVLHLDPDDANVLPRGSSRWRTDFAYTSLWLIGDNGPQQRFQMDGELLRTALDARTGLGAGFEFGVQLPFLHSSGGFLDDFVIDYHELFGFPDQDRSAAPRDAYGIGAVANGRSVWSQQAAGLELLDVPLQLTWSLRPSGVDRFGVALRGGIELPTGDAGRGYGNGQLDAAAGALFDYHTPRFGWSGHVQHTFAGTPRTSRDADFRFADVTSIGSGLELPLVDGLVALVQAEWETSTLRRLDVPAAARDQMLLWVGGRLALAPDWSVEVAFGEDLIGKVSPDFTAWLSFAWQPGAAASRR